MVILLPLEKEGLAAMEEKLKTFPLESIPSKLRERKVSLQMPKFTLETTMDLKGPLQKVFFRCLQSNLYVRLTLY